MKGPLSGVRVVEMSTFVAGPAAARLLADMGAEVIKVEVPSGDGWRVSSISYAKRFEENENPVFDIYNAGKQFVSLNLKDPEGKEAFNKLLASADVFVTNLRPAALRRLGIYYDDIKELYPRLIYAIVLGYGEKGPDADKPAFDTTAFWSRTGFLRDMAVKGEGYMPVAAPYSVGDTATAYLLMGEVCAALYRRSVTGEGDFVSSTLYHNGVFCMGSMITLAQEGLENVYPKNRIDHGVPIGAYECKDGEWVYFAIGNAKVTLPGMYRLLGYPDLADDPRFDTADKRRDNRYELYEYIHKAFLTKTAAEWEKLAEENDLPLARMRHFEDVSKDPQAWANGFLQKEECPNGNVDIVPTSPIEMNSATPHLTTPAPKPGADTAKVLSQLGYTEAQVEAMIANGAASVAK